MNFLFRSGHHDRFSERSRPDALAVCQHRHDFAASACTADNASPSFGSAMLTISSVFAEVRNLSSNFLAILFSPFPVPSPERNSL